MIKSFRYLIYIAKIIIHYNSKNITRVLTLIVNCEMCIATYIDKKLLNNIIDT